MDSGYRNPRHDDLATRNKIQNSQQLHLKPLTS